jgi:hypothetical protein
LKSLTLKSDLREPWILLCLLVIPLLLSLPCFLGYSWAAGDLLRQFYPWKELGRQAILAGRLPLWNPYVYCGMPLLGNFQSGLAYPPHFVFYFLPFTFALGWHLLFHFFLSGLGFYALCRALGISEGPALIAALSWQGNAFLLARVEFMSALSAYAWTPWILWSFAAGRGLALSACLIGLQVLSGYPLELAYCLLASLILVSMQKRESFLRLSGAWILGLSAGALQLFPGLELLKRSSRLAGGQDAKVTELLHPQHVVTWILPFEAQIWQMAFSISLPVIVLVLFARGKNTILALIYIILGLGLSFGLGANFVPNRHPALALIYCAMGLALLAGQGAQTLAKRLSPGIILLLASLILIQALLPWLWRSTLLSNTVFRPSPTAQFLKIKMEPNSRILLSPAVQEEVNSVGQNSDQAWGRFAEWLQANSSAPSGIHDANGYDPLAPGAIVNYLNAAAFPVFAKESQILDLLGVEALVDWDSKAGRFTPAISRRPHPPLRTLLVEDAAADLLSLDTPIVPDAIHADRIDALSKRSQVWKLSFQEESPELLKIHLPEHHPAGWVFLNDTYYPGWQAQTDGEATSIHEALGAFRAVKVSETTRDVLMQYRPGSFFLGATLSLLAWLLIACLGWATRCQSPEFGREI